MDIMNHTRTNRPGIYQTRQTEKRVKHPYLDSGKKRSPGTLMVTCPLTHVSFRSMKPRTPKCLEGIVLTRFPWLLGPTLTAVPLPVRPYDLTSVHPSGSGPAPRFTVCAVLHLFPEV